MTRRAFNFTRSRIVSGAPGLRPANPRLQPGPNFVIGVHFLRSVDKIDHATSQEILSFQIFGVFENDEHASFFDPLTVLRE